MLRHVRDERDVAFHPVWRGVQDGLACRRDRVHYANGPDQYREGQEDVLLGLAVERAEVGDAVLVKGVQARLRERCRKPGQTLFQRERVCGVAVCTGHVEADVGVGAGEPAAVSGREMQRADDHVRAIHGHAEGLSGEASQRAECGVVPALRAADVVRDLGAALLTCLKVLGAAV